MRLSLRKLLQYLCHLCLVDMIACFLFVFCSVLFFCFCFLFSDLVSAVIYILQRKRALLTALGQKKITICACENLQCGLKLLPNLRLCSDLPVMSFVGKVFHKLVI